MKAAVLNRGPGYKAVFVCQQSPCRLCYYAGGHLASPPPLEIGLDWCPVIRNYKHIKKRVLFWLSSWAACFGKFHGPPLQKSLLRDPSSVYKRDMFYSPVLSRIDKNVEAPRLLVPPQQPIFFHPPLVLYKQPTIAVILTEERKLASYLYPFFSTEAAPPVAEH